MDDAVVDDDKKNFDAEHPEEDDHLPDPEEIIFLEQGHGRVWLVKIPKFLMERWSSVTVEDMHLATLRVYQPPPNAPPGKPPRIMLFLPPAPYSTPDPTRPVFTLGKTVPTTPTEPDCYELEMVNDAVENQIVVAERPKDATFSMGDAPPSIGPPNPRARATILTGRVKHECSLRPGFNDNYRKQMRERHLKYNTPHRQIVMIEDTNMSKSNINRLSSGAGPSTSTFSDLVKPRTKGRGKGAERMARMPRNQLLDLIFQLFRHPTHWAIKDLRIKTQQPTAFLKETLAEVAFLHKNGEHTGLYELKPNFKDEGIKGEHVPIPSLDGLTKMEEDDEDDEDEDDDEDMEEVS